MFLNLEDFEEVDDAPSKQEGGYNWIKIVDGGWIYDGKWEMQTSIVQNVETGKFYEYSLCRSGSYYSGYYYVHREDNNGVNLREVVKKERVITETYWEYV